MSNRLDYIWNYADTYEFMEKVQKGMPPLIVCVACNGGVQGKEYNENIPEEPDEIANSVYGAYRAGASIVHIHARDPNNLASCAKTTDVWYQVNQKVRERCPDIIINNTTGGGLGGCPYAPGAAGSLATEDLVYMCARMGLCTGVDLEALFAATSHIARVLGRGLPGRVFTADGSSLAEVLQLPRGKQLHGREGEAEEHRDRDGTDTSASQAKRCLGQVAAGIGEVAAGEPESQRDIGEQHQLSDERQVEVAGQHLQGQREAQENQVPPLPGLQKRLGTPQG